MSYIIKSPDDLQDPFLCLCIFMRFDEDSGEALNMIMHGWDEINGALCFESCDGESWHSRNLEYVTSYGNMRFYK